MSKSIITISVDTETKERWQATAARSGISLSKYIRRCVEFKGEQPIPFSATQEYPEPPVPSKPRHTDVDTLSGMAGIIPAAPSPQIEPSRVVSKVKNAKKPAKVRDRGPAVCEHRIRLDSYCSQCRTV